MPLNNNEANNQLSLNLNFILVDDEIAKIKFWKKFLPAACRTAKLDCIPEYQAYYTVPEAEQALAKLLKSLAQASTDITNSQEAPQTIPDQPLTIYVFLLDHNVKERSGAELLKTIVKISRKQKVVVACISGSADDSEVQNIFNTQVLDENNQPQIEILFYSSALRDARPLMKKVKEQFVISKNIESSSKHVKLTHPPEEQDDETASSSDSGSSSSDHSPHRSPRLGLSQNILFPQHGSLIPACSEPTENQIYPQGNCC